MRERILAEALPGTEVTKVPNHWARLPDQPWKFWETPSGRWAVFAPIGDRLADVTVASIKKTVDFGLKPLLVATSHRELETIANRYMDICTHIACDVGGCGTLVPPPRLGAISEKRARRNRTRVPRQVLKELGGMADLSAPLRHKLAQLSKTYGELRRANNDNDEQKLLSRFATSVLSKMGFASRKVKAADMLRRLEQAYWNGKRDHFFHSFQNYFLGLVAVSRLLTLFRECQEVTGLRWDVDPFDVWFLTALYHDVGYGIQNFENITSDIWGLQDPSGVASYTLSQFLSTAATRTALREISSLIARLLDWRPGVSTWMPPSESARRATEEVQVEKGIVSNLSEGHGAAGALLLHSELMPIINRMIRATKDRLRQTVLLASCSIPFHDWRFRRALRTAHDSCSVPTGGMPYAATLAFVDSLQEDRRDLEGIRAEVRFLESLLVKRRTHVVAKVNMQALRKEDVLWKIVEARDVISALQVGPGAPSFGYPSWMTA